MSLVLAIETNASQADTLRQIGRDLDGVELIVVPSAPAAVAAMNLETPDLILFGSNLPAREHDEVVAYLEALADAEAPETLAIPTLRAPGDPEAPEAGDDRTLRAFAEQIVATLSKRGPRTPRDLDTLLIDPPEAGSATDSDINLELLTEDFGTSPLALDEFESNDTGRLHSRTRAPQDNNDVEASLGLAQMLPGDAVVDPAAHAAEIALIQEQADRRLEAELERVRAQAAEERAADLIRQQAEADALREVAVNEARAAAEAEVRESLAAQIARVRGEAEQTLAAELARLRADAVKALADELGRTRAEADQALDAQLAIVKAETDSMRSEVVQEAQNAAERIAARALEDEIAVVRARTEARLQTELDRVREEAERARKAATARIEAEAVSVDDGGSSGQGWKAPSDVNFETQFRIESHGLRRTGGDRGRSSTRRAGRVDQGPAHSGVFESPPVPAVVVVTPDEPGDGESLLPQGAARWRLAAVLLLVLVTSGLLRFSPGLHDRLQQIGRSALGRSSQATEPPAVAAAPAAAKAEAAIPARRPPQTGDLIVESTPAGARVIIDGEERGLTPLRLTSLRAGNHSVALESSAGSVKQMIVVRPGEEATIRQQIIPGTLAVFSRLPLELYADGRRIGTTDDGQLMLSPGTYRIGLVSERFNFKAEETLEIHPGKVTSHTVSLPAGRLHINTTPGVEVWVDGERQGVAPVGPLAVPIGTREVLVRHPQLGDQRQGVEVKHDQQTDATLLFEKPPDPRVLYPLPSLSTPGPRIR
jgi:hypothetical protein